MIRTFKYSAALVVISMTAALSSAQDGDTPFGFPLLDDREGVVGSLHRDDLDKVPDLHAYAAADGL